MANCSGPRTQRCGLAALAAALLGLAACGSSGYDTAELAKDIRARLDQHPGFAVPSARCPARAKRAEGVVIRCSATLRDGEVDQITIIDDDGGFRMSFS
jgi:hypothetical protein